MGLCITLIVQAGSLPPALTVTARSVEKTFHRTVLHLLAVGESTRVVHRYRVICAERRSLPGVQAHNLLITLFRTTLPIDATLRLLLTAAQ